MGITSGEFERDMMHAVAVGGGRCFSSRFGASIPRVTLICGSASVCGSARAFFPKLRCCRRLHERCSWMFPPERDTAIRCPSYEPLCFIPDLTCMRVRGRMRVARRLPIKGDGMAR